MPPITEKSAFQQTFVVKLAPETISRRNPRKNADQQQQMRRPAPKRGNAQRNRVRQSPVFVSDLADDQHPRVARYVDCIERQPHNLITKSWN